MLVFCTIFITSGLLLVLLASPESRSVFVSPGKLSHAHAALESGDEAQSGTCKKCHTSSKSFLGGSITNGLTTTIETTQSRLCLECHDLGNADSALLAHSISRSITTPNPTADHGSVAHSGTRVALSLARLLDDGPYHPNGEVSCSTCHSEHHGREAPLTRMSGAQCQICHAAVFGSFSNGHPEIAERYAFNEPKALNFDHTSHVDGFLTLTERDGEIHCGTCHVPDESGRHMILNDFETMCSECHADQISTDGDEDGLAVFNLPAFAQHLTRNEQDSIGAWPEKVQAKWSPYFRLLLLGDDAYPQGHDLGNDLERWSQIETQGRSGDAMKAGDTEVVGRLAMAIRRFVEQLGERENVRRRIEDAVGFPISSTESEVLLGALSASASFRSRVEHWFSTPPPAGSIKYFENEFEEAWLWEGKTSSVVYRPKHHAAPFLHTWLDLVSRLRHNRDEGDLRQKIAVEILGGLNGEESPGSCLKCHNADYIDFAGRIMWNPAPLLEPGRTSTVFTHYPHFGLVDCTGCHEQRNEDISPTSSRSADEGTGGRFSEDFAPIEIEDCSRCHVPELVGDSCLQCHYYHLGNMTQNVTNTFPSSQEPRVD